MKKHQLVITGRPVTKKNHQQVVMARGRPRIIQHKAYYVYATSAIAQLRKQFHGKTPINRAMTVCARYWMPNRRGKPDLNNLLSATADILQDAGIISDDHFIISWDGSEIVGVDKENPRVEIEIGIDGYMSKKYNNIWGAKNV